VELTTEQKETEAAKAAETDAEAMAKLMDETLEGITPPEDSGEPKIEEPKAEAPKPEPPAPPPQEPSAEPAEAKPKDAPAEPDPFESELASNKFDLPAGATKQAREIIKIVKQKANEEHRVARDLGGKLNGLQTEMEELRTKLAAATKNSDDADRYRQIVETMAIEHDPNLNTRFGNRLAQIENGVMQNLMAWGLPDKTAEYIMQHGGPAYFRKDSVSRCPAEQEGGDGEVAMSHKDFWEDRILSQLSEERQDRLKLAFDDELRVKEGHDAALRGALANRDQYFKNLEEQSQKNEEAFKAECQKELDSQLKDFGDFAKEQTVPRDATPEQKQGIEAHNAIIKDATEKFEQEFLDTTAKGLVRKALGSLYVPAARAAREQALAERDLWKGKFDELQKKWNASLKAANTSQRQSVQQQAKPLDGITFEPNDAKRMEQLLQNLPA
jgi:hypothetical protein